MFSSTMAPSALLLNWASLVCQENWLSFGGTKSTGNIWRFTVIFGGSPADRAASMKAQLRTDVTEISSRNDLRRPNPDLHDRSVKVLVPPITELAQTWICLAWVIMPAIQVLPDECLDQRRMVRHAVEDLGCGLSPTGQLTHQVMGVHRLAPWSVPWPQRLSGTVM
jgi:hypothetical protein